jgi:hypothetical protein
MKTYAHVLDTGNCFNVVPDNGDVRYEPFIHHPTTLSRAAALNLAVWLSLTADPEGVDFCALYNAIKKS